MHKWIAGLCLFCLIFSPAAFADESQDKSKRDVISEIFPRPIPEPQKGPLKWEAFKVRAVDVETGRPVPDATIHIVYRVMKNVNMSYESEIKQKAMQKTNSKGIARFAPFTLKGGTYLGPDGVSGAVYHEKYNDLPFGFGQFLPFYNYTEGQKGIRGATWTFKDGVLTAYMAAHQKSISSNHVTALVANGPYLYAATKEPTEARRNVFNWSRFDTGSVTWEQKSPAPPGWVDAKASDILEKAYEPDGSYWQAFWKRVFVGEKPEGWYDFYHPFEGVEAACPVHVDKDGKVIESISLEGVLYYTKRVDIAISKDAVWLSNGLLIRVDKKTHKITKIKYGDILKGPLTALATHGDDLYVGTGTKGLTRYNTKTGKVDWYYY